MMDDGSASLEESLAMLRASHAQGVTDVVLTPHFYALYDNPTHFLEKRHKRLTELQEALEGEQDVPHLIPGVEVRYFEGITEMEELPEMRIKGTTCLLLELPFTRWTPRVLEDVIELGHRREFTVILAHVERYPELGRKGTPERLLSEGILFQSNAEFFLGRFKAGKALRMLGTGRIHLLGSDSHNMTTRPPNLGAAYDVIAKKYGDEMPEMIYRNGQHLLQR